MKTFSLLLLPLGAFLFLLLKLPHLSVRISDTNVYFYTAYNLLGQQLLYKDIFFTNLPLFPYISSFYQLLTFGRLEMFYATTLIEVIIITILVFFIVFKKTKNYLTSSLSSLLYMFSTIILITSDHQTGVFTASILMLLVYIFLEKKNFLLSGVFAGLSLLTKAYFLPIAISFAIYLFFIKKGKYLFTFLSGIIIVSIAILIPFIFQAGKELMTDVLYSVTRGGANNLDVIRDLILYDFILFVVFIFNLFNFKKNSLFAIISLTSIFFLLFYQGLYYLYLNFIIPFLAISFYYLSNFLTDKKQIFKTLLPIIILLSMVINITYYTFYFSKLSEVKDINHIVELIKKENPKYLYGTTDITPALAYLSNVALLNNIIDTNPNIFRKGILDGKKLTQNAIGSKTIIITRGKSSSDLIVENAPINDIFDAKLLQKHCKHIASFPSYPTNSPNRINLLKCY